MLTLHLLFPPPGWLENTANDPKLAGAEILYLTVRLREIGTENREVREKRDDLEKKLARETQRFERLLLAQSLAQERESLRLRDSERAHKRLETGLDGLKQLRADLGLKLRKAELSRDREAARSRHLEHRGKQLEAASKRQDGKAISAIRKLSRDRTVSKRMAAVFHPDKVPSALCEVASEMFRLIQSLREEREETNEK